MSKTQYLYVLAIVYFAFNLVHKANASVLINSLIHFCVCYANMMLSQDVHLSHLFNETSMCKHLTSVYKKNKQGGQSRIFIIFREG